MSGPKRPPTGGRAPDADSGLGEDPLADADPLVEAFYRREADEADDDAPRASSPEPARRPPAASAPARERAGAEEVSAKKEAEGEGRRRPLPEGKTYRLVTFSFYEEDVARLDDLLAEARRRGHRKTSRSQIVRLALRQVDLDDLPEPL